VSCIRAGRGILGNLWPAAVAAHLRRKRADVVHVHSGVWFRGAWAGRLAGVRRVIHTVHGLLDHEPWFDRPLKRAATMLTDDVVAVSNELRDYLVHRIGLPALKIRVIPNGVDVGRFAPGPADSIRAELSIPPGAAVIGMVARMEQGKNPHLLLAAFSRVLAFADEAYLLFVGDGTERLSLENAASESGLRDRVRFVGTRIDTPELYRAMDIVVLSSNAEGAPMSILEGMATEKPVVCTAVGGVPGLLDNGRCGVLTPPGDADALASALIDLLQAPLRRIELGALARSRVEMLYSVSAMSKAYHELYRSRKTRQ
jgi:glycosyltransferase involved in cell wall biosynthesis